MEIPQVYRSDSPSNQSANNREKQNPSSGTSIALLSRRDKHELKAQARSSTARLIHWLELELSKDRRVSLTPNTDIVGLADELIDSGKPLDLKDDMIEALEKGVEARSRLLGHYYGIEDISRYENADKVVAHLYFIDR